MRFLGMSGYFRKLCQNFSDIVSPLTNLLRKDVSYNWSTDCQKAFEKIKAVLTNYPVLKAPDFSKEFTLAVDASESGVGAVLLQKDDNDVEHPVCYYSKKLLPHQRKYSTIEKEALALVQALQHFEVYLKNTLYEVKVYTDHNPLTFINKMKNFNQKLLRWSILLQEFNLRIFHIKGKDNVIADTLSRQ